MQEKKTEIRYGESIPSSPKKQVVTTTGTLIDLEDPHNVSPKEISRILARVIRYGGRIPDESRWPAYSVAEHSVLVSHLAEKMGAMMGLSAKDQRSLALMGLMHDSAESLTGDIITPVKEWIGPEFSRRDKTLEYAVMEAQHKALGLEFTFNQAFAEIVHRADRMALMIEVPLLGIHPDAYEQRHPQALADLRQYPVSRSDLSSWGLFQPGATDLTVRETFDQAHRLYVRRMDRLVLAERLDQGLRGLGDGTSTLASTLASSTPQQAAARADPAHRQLDHTVL